MWSQPSLFVSYHKSVPSPPAFCRSDIDAGDLPQTALGEAQRQQLASLPVQSVHLDCLIDFLYRPSAQRKMQFVDSLPVQLRILAESPPVNLQQVSPSQTQRLQAIALLQVMHMVSALVRFCSRQATVMSFHLSKTSQSKTRLCSWSNSWAAPTSAAHVPVTLAYMAKVSVVTLLRCTDTQPHMCMCFELYG